MSPFFARWLGRSLRASMGGGGVAVAALALSSALVFCLVAVSEGAERQLGRELRVYGANLLLLPRLAPLRFGLGAFELGEVGEDQTLEAARLADLPPALVETAAAGLQVTVGVGGGEAGAVGYDLAALRRLNPLWRIAGRWPAGPAEALVGAGLAARLAVAPGRIVEVTAAGRVARVELAGVVETGGAEDEQLLLPLGTVQALTGRAGQASFVLIRSAPGPAADAVATSLEALLPGTEVRTLRQVAQAEAGLLATVRRLLLLVTLALAAATAFTVSGTVGVLLLARRQEIGLYLGLGAAPRRVRLLLLAEAAARGLTGGLAGCLLGAAAAEGVARSVFGASVPLPPAAALLSVGVSLATALAASLWPVERALRISPCDSLRAP